LVDVAVCPNPTFECVWQSKWLCKLQHTLELVFDILSGNIVGAAALLLLLYAFLFLPTGEYGSLSGDLTHNLTYHSPGCEKEKHTEEAKAQPHQQCSH